MRKFLVLLVSVFSVATLVCSAADRGNQLKIQNWADYIDEALLKEFPVWYEEQTGEKVEIIYQTFDVNEIMLSKIEKGHEDFDVVCPSDYIIERMLAKNLILPIDKDFGQVPDYTATLAPCMVDFLRQIKASGKDASMYAVPYMWGTVGLLYNKKYVSEEEAQSWDVLNNPKFQGKILMKEAFRDVYNTFNIALQHEAIKNGERTVSDICWDTSEEAINRVETYLNEIKPNLAGWEADFGKEQLAKGKAWINFSWSGDAKWAINEGAKLGIDLGYSIPKEGSSIFFDAWVIPVYAKNIKAARYFINYLCMPENVIRNMNVSGYVSAIGSKEVLEAISDSSLYSAHDVSYFFGSEATAACVDPVYYPSLENIRSCGMMHDCGSEELLAMWTRVKGENTSAMTNIILAVVLGLIVFAVISSRKKKKRRHSR